MTACDLGSRAQIRAHQLDELRRLLDELLPGNRFYTPVLREAGIDGSISDLEEFFAKMPFTEKKALVEDQRLHPPYGTNLTYPLARYTRLHQTSATSGVPMRWLDTPESWQWMLESWKQVYRAAGASAADCIYFAFSFGPFLGFWTAFDAATQLGALSIPAGGLSSVARLEGLRAHRATVLCSTPTYALRLAQVAAEESIDLAAFDVRTIIVAGEPGGSIPAVRESIEAAWPTARVFDHHGMTEVGPVSHECPDEPGSLIIMESAYLPEIIDPETLRPVEPGAAGELVLTTLGRLGSPLLRYRTGDLVRQHPIAREAGGRFGLILEGGILGRVDDMIHIRGVNVFPSAVDEVLHSFPEVVEYRVEVYRQRSLPEIRIQVEPAAGYRDLRLLRLRMQERFRALFNLRVSIVTVEPGSLPRFEMKAKRWRRA
ncbi:MAG: AMP-binding protein [Planctomycetes bacterium]|nr:AMP-binding protein [Planctomycetota bacterium]